MPHHKPQEDKLRTGQTNQKQLLILIYAFKFLFCLNTHEGLAQGGQHRVLHCCLRTGQATKSQLLKPELMAHF